jgi:chemosensory pili system protein ChpA (sensor histidine kinase/response regulator)
MSFPPVTPNLTHPAVQDLGPLTWVVDDVRRCLEQAAKAVATGQPALAEAPLHQAAGAIEMTGSTGAAGVARKGAMRR